MSSRTGEEQLAARKAGTAAGDMTAAELRAITNREQRRDAAKQLAMEEFKRAQAEGKAQGRTVLSQDLRVNLDSGSVRGRTTSVDSSAFRRQQDQTPTQAPVSDAYTQPPTDIARRYVDPRHNQQFGSKRVGDIINEEVAKGDKGLYKSRQSYDLGEVKQFTSEIYQ
jgi:hypothetical protein